MSEETPQSPILISEIHLQNLLSFGPDAKPIPLGPLNVLIGANGSGKSNLIEAISLLKAMPNVDLRKFFSLGGGVDEWIWKYDSLSNKSSIRELNGIAKMRVLIPNDELGAVYHDFWFDSIQGLFEVHTEAMGCISGEEEVASFLFRLKENGIIHSSGNGGHPSHRQFRLDTSALAQFKDAEAYPIFSVAEDAYLRIKIYREFQFGRNAAIRQPQTKNMPDDSLEEDFSNLALFLRRILAEQIIKERFLECLKDLYDGLTDIAFEPTSGHLEIYLEEGECKFPAIRLSDGTLRYLCLLAILLDPTPPPLICIEEPELGMHPDIIFKIADLLIEASKRTQIIVTTHSDVIIDVLSYMPESVLVCEKHQGMTKIQRLEAEEVAPFLERYRLGELWMSGALGGTRW